MKEGFSEAWFVPIREPTQAVVARMTEKLLAIIVQVDYEGLAKLPQHLGTDKNADGCPTFGARPIPG